MKYIKLIVYFVAFLLPTHVIAENSELDKAAAEKTFLDYFGALTRGDTLTMRSLLTGNLLEKRSRLLDNPTYPAYLANIYRDAHASIEKLEPANSSGAVIDVSITFDEGDVSQRRFLLRKEPRSGANEASYHIYDEMPPLP